MSTKKTMLADLCFDLADLPSDEARKKFDQAGCLQISNFLPDQKIRALAEAFANLHADHPTGHQALKVGTKRHMLSIPVEGAFNDPALYAPPELASFFEGVLGQGFLLSCMTCVVALPDATTQHQHQDFAGLFGDRLDYFAPSFAVNLFLPLVPLNGVNGTTRMWPYSHRKPDIENDDGIYPALEPGSAMLMDYRVLHEGTPNLSKQNRPILCLAYSRDWFLDCRHFGEVNPLDIDAENLAQMEPRHRALFSRAKLYRNSRSQS